MGIPYTNEMFLSESHSDGTNLYLYNLITGKKTQLVFFSDSRFNAMGYNPIDNCLYAIRVGSNQIFKIDYNGNSYTINNIGAPTGFPVISGVSYNCGVIDNNGYFYVACAATISNSNVGKLFCIDLNSSRSTYMHLVNPVNGFSSATTSNYRIFPLDDYANQATDLALNYTTGELMFITTNGRYLTKCIPTLPVTSSNPREYPVTNLPNLYPLYSSFGAQICDSLGRMYVLANLDGRLYRIDNTSINQYKGTLISYTGIISTSNDGAINNRIEIEMDFGDAPDLGEGNGPGNYKTLMERDGPRHQINRTEPLYLGLTATSELDAYQNSTATGDDQALNIQDDGISGQVPAIIRGESTYSIDVIVTNETQVAAYLYGWVDFDVNGIFAVRELMDNGPIIIPQGTGPIVVNIKWTIPASNQTVLNNNEHTFLRLRLTTDSVFINQSIPSNTSLEDPRTVGAANTGEVEDFIIMIQEPQIRGVLFI